MRKVELIEYLVIGLYLVFMLGTGLLFRRLVSNFYDYFKGGSRGSWWMVGASAFMASFSAWTFTGASGVAYMAGISVAMIFVANVIGYLVNFFFTAHLFRQLRATTFPEVIRARYNVLTQQAYVWIGIIPGILMASLTLYGVAIFANAIFGFSIQNIIIVLGIVVLLYSTIGGIWSVMATDFLQTLILMPMAILMTYLSLKYVGGPGAMVEKIKAMELHGMLKLIDNTGKTPYSWIWSLALITFVILTYNSLGSAVRFFYCKDGKEARKASLFAAILMLTGCFIWFIPPIVARLEFSSLVEAVKIQKPAEASYAVIAMQLLPNGLSGLMVVAMFSATMSSLDTILNQTAAVMTQDIYKPFKLSLLGSSLKKKELFVVGQVISFLTGSGIILAALYFSKQEGSGVFQYMLDFGALFGTPMIVPMFLSTFIRKTPSWSAMASIIAGFCFSIMSHQWGLGYAHTVFSIAAAGSVTFMATTLFWKYESKKYKEKVDDFYKVMHTPVDFEKEIGKSADASQLNMIGAISMLIGFFISLLVFLKNPFSGRMQILAVGAGMMAIGAIFLTLGIRSVKKQKNLQENNHES